MRFEWLKIKDFMSIESAHLPLADRGLVAVIGRNSDDAGAGSNGSGKSALWDALQWVLYGKVSRKLEFANRVVRREAKKAEVEVEIQADNGLWLIRRTQTAKASELVLTHDGVEFTGITKEGTQDKINKLIGMDHPTFAVSVIFGQDTFRFASATDKEQKVILDRLLGLEVYEQARKTAAEWGKTAAEQKIKAQASRASTQNQQAHFRSVIGVHQANIARWDAEQITIRQSAERRIAEAKEALGTLNIVGGLLPEKRAELEKVLFAINEQNGTLNAERGNLSLYQSQLTALKRSVMPTGQSAGQLQFQITDKEAKIARLSEVPLCGKCGQSIGLEEQAKQIIEIEEERDRIKAEMDGILTKLASPEYNQQVHDLEAKIAALNSIGTRLANLEVSRRETSAKLAGLNAEERQIVSKRASYEAVINSDTDGQVERLKADSQAAKAEIKKLEDQIANLDGELVVHDAAVLIADETLRRIEFWDKAFGPSGIRSFILDSVVPYLTNRAQHYADILMDGSLSISFETQKALKGGDLREEFQIKVMNAFGAEGYGGNSAGERQRVDLCVALALHDLARTRARNPVELMIFDEAFERVDEAGQERVLKLLNKESKDWKSCFVITHLPALAGLFGQNLCIVKTGGRSILEQGAGDEGKAKGLGGPNQELESRSAPARFRTKNQAGVDRPV